jgi:hypothetical protein
MVTSFSIAPVALPVEAVVPIENQNPKNNYFLIATPGNVYIHYTGMASAHVWHSYYAEFVT